jgi:hypothetical protein
MLGKENGNNGQKRVFYGIWPTKRGFELEENKLLKVVIKRN